MDEIAPILKRITNLGYIVSINRVNGGVEMHAVNTQTRPSSTSPE